MHVWTSFLLISRKYWEVNFFEDSYLCFFLGLCLKGIKKVRIENSICCEILTSITNLIRFIDVCSPWTKRDIFLSHPTDCIILFLDCAWVELNIRRLVSGGNLFSSSKKRGEWFNKVLFFYFVGFISSVTAIFLFSFFYIFPLSHVLTHSGVPNWAWYIFFQIILFLCFRFFKLNIKLHWIWVLQVTSKFTWLSWS